MVQQVLRWERQERWSSRRRQGPMAEKCHFSIFLINLLSIRLNHIIAHETYHCCLDLPLKLAPTCFTKQRGTSKNSRIWVQIFVFVLPTAIFGIWRLVIYRWKGLENTFPTVYYHVHKFSKIKFEKHKKKNLYSFSDCKSGWSKQMQWEIF